MSSITNFLGRGTAVGKHDVIKMHYTIGMGSIARGSPETILAHTNSYIDGISLSEIKWGFYNTSEMGTKESSYLEFTLHDIAGQTLSNFIKLKQGASIIYYLGPASDGYPWSPPNFALYKPIVNDCKLEFSPTQGFTYTFVAMPIGNLTKTTELAAPADLKISGKHKGVRHDNMFADYLDEIALEWNTAISALGDKAGSAQIEFHIESDGINPDMEMRYPVFVNNTNEGNHIKTEGDAETELTFTVKKGIPIATEVQRLWNKHFLPPPATEADDCTTLHESMVEVNFNKYEGGISIIDVRCHKKEKSEPIIPILPVCIGTDETCSGTPYRAQLVGMNFDGIMPLLAAAKFSAFTGAKVAEAAVAGNASTTEKPNNENVCGIKSNETTADIPHSAGLPAGVNPLFDGWSELSSVLNTMKTPAFTLDIELPFTSDFSPKVHGGKLPDTIEGCAMGSIKYTSGLNLKFWWYTDPSCETLIPVKSISNDYRITKIIHTIGLNGNTTQVSLSHLTIHDV